MIKSMTGFGKAILEKNLRSYQVEIKSINHRYLDISVRMPREISYLEEIIKKEISKSILRGKIDVFINFNNNSMEGKEIKINTNLAKKYIKELKKLAEEENLNSDISVNEIAKYPEVLTVEQNVEDEEIKKEIIEVINKAVESLLKMKISEGEKIAKDLNERLEEIQEKVNEVSKFSAGLIGEYIVKLEERIKQILNDQEIDKKRLAEEVVIYAEKSSIEEEITRINSHIAQFKNLLSSEKPVGKKLDFIIQEMNRETNTIGSKSSSLNITNSVIDMKTEIENLREQIQNIE